MIDILILWTTLHFEGIINLHSFFMLTAIEKVYLKHYKARYGDLTLDEIDAKCQEAERCADNFQGRPEQLHTEVMTLVELIYFAGLKQVEISGNTNDVMFFASGQLDTNGQLRPLPPQVRGYVRDYGKPHWYGVYDQREYFVFIDVDPASPEGLKLRKEFNTTNTAPRIARIDYVTKCS